MVDVVAQARPLTYHAVHRMFERAVDKANGAATLHSLRHTAAYRMAEDTALPLTDVQLVLGHALLSTTQIYLTPRKEEVIRRVLAHHADRTRRAAERARPAPAPGYRPESLDVLFRVKHLVSTVIGNDTWLSRRRWPRRGRSRVPPGRVGLPPARSVRRSGRG